MVATVQSTRPYLRTILISEDDGPMPATITADYLHRWPERMPFILSAFDAANNARVALDTFRTVLEAVRDGGAVVVLYADAKAELMARVLWPETVTLTKGRHICCRAYCTYRREWRAFRLDRFVTCHTLTTPDDVAAA